jgi:hypothetical protein
VILLTRDPEEVDFPSDPAQISNQLLGLDGDRSVESLLDLPTAIELVDDQVGMSLDRHSPWRARTQTFQDMKDAGILRHIVGHGATLADQAASLREDWLIYPATASMITPTLL